MIAVNTVTPRMARITVAGPDLAEFAWDGGDQSVMLYLYPEDTNPPADLTAESARAMFARIRPDMRTYTIRRHDPATREIDFDFVLHGDHGPASRWASAACPGQELIFVGPAPAHGLTDEVDAHLLIGDETALPAISVLLSELPEGTRATTVIEIADDREIQDLGGRARVDTLWVPRNGRPPGDNGLLADAVRGLDLPSATIGVWAAGEKSAMAGVRRHLVGERGFDRRAVRPHTYWRA